MSLTIWGYLFGCGLASAITYAVVHHLLEHRGHRCKWIIYREETLSSNNYRDEYCKCGGRRASYQRHGKTPWHVTKMTRPIREEGTA